MSTLDEVAQEPVQIRVEFTDFNVGEEYERLRRRSAASGAIVLFTGLVRDFNAEGKLQGITLEHYPAMTIKSIRAIVDDAMVRWQLSGVTVIHRVGVLQNHDQIVLVAVSARHRNGAFDGASFIMDYLKTEAPFWKKEILADGEETWVEARDSDQRARERW